MKTHNILQIYQLHSSTIRCSVHTEVLPSPVGGVESEVQTGNVDDSIVVWLGVKNYNLPTLCSREM